MPYYRRDYLANDGVQLLATHLSLGHDPKTYDELLLPNQKRTMGTHLIGMTGMGKSSELKGMVYQDALQRRAVFVFDPHDDLIDEIVAELPQERIAYTHVLDLRDEGFPFGVNLFSMAGKLNNEEERTQAVQRIWHIFTVLWPEVKTQQHLPMLLRQAINAFLDNPGATLVDMMLFFKQDEKGDQFRAHILRNVHDRTIREFFEEEFNHFSRDEQRRRVSPLMIRLQSLFVGRGLVRNILGQRKNSIDFRRAILNREIVLIKLPTKTMEEDARLLGTVIMAQLTAAIFSFGDQPPEQRPGVSVYVDEFHNFATPDFKRLAEEGRKFGMRLTVAHQNLDQLPDFCLTAVNGMHTRIVMRVSHADARALAPIFPARTTGTGGEVIIDTVKYLLDQGCSDPLVRTFIETYLRPFQAHKKAGKVEIERKYFDVDWKKTLLWGAKAGAGMYSYEEPDPTPYLDNLFRDVMRSRDPMLPIADPRALLGLANSGIGFYGAICKLHQNSPEFTGHVTFPEYLANRTAQGYVWLRQPHDEREQLLHCIFHLRMTMRYLAEHPILKGGKAPSVDYAQLLIQLPERIALVKYGDDVGMIRTNDTPQGLAGEALRARRFFIQEQTRQTYCHPRCKIEDLIDATTPPDPSTYKRWEEVT